MEIGVIMPVCYEDSLRTINLLSRKAQWASKINFKDFMQVLSEREQNLVMLSLSPKL
jgi:hypothetical protein